mmetsp:Transcript_7552/g.21460  ORF Transcript_7552/g.21460 Transcript_7552/m.21460 type:complete len:220 (+) Transcript_7552:298-957(+)
MADVEESGGDKGSVGRAETDEDCDFARTQAWERNRDDSMELPNDCWVLVAEFLDQDDVIFFALASRCFYQVVKRAGREMQTRERAVAMSVGRAEWSLRRFGVAMQVKICLLAAAAGSLEVLRWARESGYPWFSRTCEMAAKRGHLDCLRFARENGCPWDNSTCWAAAGAGHLDCLQYAVENGCPWDDWTLHFAKSRGHTAMVEWLQASGRAKGSSLLLF